MGAAGGLAGMQFIGGVMQARNNLEASKVEAKQLRQQAEFRDMQADRIGRSVELQDQELRKEGQLIKGQIKSIAGQSGVTLEGTPMALLEQAAADVERESYILKEAGANQVWATRKEAQILRENAIDVQKAGVNNFFSGIMGATGRAGLTAASFQGTGSGKSTTLQPTGSYSRGARGTTGQFNKFGGLNA